MSGWFWKTRRVDQAIEMLEHGEGRGRRGLAVVTDLTQPAEPGDRAGPDRGSRRARLDSAAESVDTETATGKFACGMLAEFAAFESDRIADVWREVRNRRISLGLPPWGHEQFGYMQATAVRLAARNGV